VEKGRDTVFFLGKIRTSVGKPVHTKKKTKRDLYEEQYLIIKEVRDSSVWSSSAAARRKSYRQDGGAKKSLLWSAMCSSPLRPRTTHVAKAGDLLLVGSEATGDGALISSCSRSR
jgi:hypothetical protein